MLCDLREIIVHLWASKFCVNTVVALSAQLIHWGLDDGKALVRQVAEGRVDPGNRTSAFGWVKLGQIPWRLPVPPIGQFTHAHSYSCRTVQLSLLPTAPSGAWYLQIGEKLGT